MVNLDAPCRHQAANPANHGSVHSSWPHSSNRIHNRATTAFLGWVLTFETATRFADLLRDHAQSKATTSSSSSGAVFRVSAVGVLRTADNDPGLRHAFDF